MSARSTRNRGTFGREILAVLTFKVFGLAALYLLFFTPVHRVTVTDQGLASHLFAASPLTITQTRDER